jgi:hypothetical protein
MNLIECQISKSKCQMVDALRAAIDRVLGTGFRVLDTYTVDYFGCNEGRTLNIQ